MLINTATEEIGHIEMLATAVALNSENAPSALQEIAVDSVVKAAMGGENPRQTIEGMLHRHILSTGMDGIVGARPFSFGRAELFGPPPRSHQPRR